MTKALSIQVQPHRSECAGQEIHDALETFASDHPLIVEHTVEPSDDSDDDFTFTFLTHHLAELWAEVHRQIYGHEVIGVAVARASIAVCHGTDGWNDYLLLHHFDSSQPTESPEP